MGRCNCPRWVRVIDVGHDAEQEARARLRFQEEELRRQEEDRRVEERRRAEAVVALAHRWKEACLVREFVASIREQAVNRFGAIEPGDPAENWINFAVSVANQIDPTAEIFKGPDRRARL